MQGPEQSLARVFLGGVVDMVTDVDDDGLPLPALRQRNSHAIAV